MKTLILILIALCGVAAAQAPAAAEETAPRTAVKSDTYVIGAEDVIAVDVWHEQEISRVVPVRPDGKIALPLAGEFEAAGKTAAQLEADITKRLESLIQKPQVTVIVQDVRSQKFSIMGEVNRPGAYPRNEGMTVLEAIAAAGGLKDFANTKKIYILRRDESGTKRINVRYKELLNGKDDPAAIIQARDVVMIP